MSGPLLSVLLLVVVHIVGMGLLIALMGPELLGIFRVSPSGEDGDDGGSRLEPDPAPLAPGGDGVPLPDALPAGVRLREPGRLAEHYRRPRRPEHVPQPARTPERV